jgi:two-component system, response regulator YesN
MSKKTAKQNQMPLETAAFKHICSAFRANFNLPLETTEPNGFEVQKLCETNCHPAFCKLVRSSATGARRCYQDRLRSLEISNETGQPYMSICHAGIVLVCVPIVDREKPLGGLFFGKCLYDHPNEHLINDILKGLRGIRISKAKIIEAANQLPIIPGRKLHEAAQFLFIMLYEVSGLDPRVIKWRRERSIQQSQIGEFIREQKRLNTGTQYPLDAERELINKVKIGDRTGAKEILNCILGMIMLHDPGDLNVLKARLLELLSVLGRAAVEGGVDIETLLEKNVQYINRAVKIDSQQDLCAWLSSALNEFIELVYASQDARRVTQIKPAIDFIDQNYDQPITLSDIAKSAFLSVSRLAHVFKEQMNITIIDYLTNVRIEKAKQLLLSTDKSCTEICFQVGYNNQSYFTRTFKKVTSMTPRKFRESNRRPPSRQAS